MLINGVFEGGGIKGLAYIGAIKFLEERGYQFKYVGGSSVGALCASLIAAKFKAKEMEELVANFDINILTSTKSKKPINKFINGIKYKGLYSLAFFENYLDNLFKTKGYATFRDVKVGEDYLLKIIVTDYKKKKMVIIPTDLGEYNYSKDSFPIAKAVVMSCSMPIVFVPYKIHNNIFIDGGVVNNFPINLFINSSIPTVGFRLNENEKPNLILNTIKNKLFKLNIDTKFSSYNIVDINTKGYKVTDFKIGLKNYKDLIKLGYNSMRDYFYKKTWKNLLG